MAPRLCSRGAGRPIGLMPLRCMRNTFEANNAGSFTRFYSFDIYLHDLSTHCTTESWARRMFELRLFLPDIRDRHTGRPASA